MSKDTEASDILKEIAVRRFRLLGGQNKYEYRCEEEHGADFKKETQLAELFFGLYHKKLIHIESKKGRGRERGSVDFYTAIWKALSLPVRNSDKMMP